jgi:geranylgeranyl pyrophosphate synthase
MRNAVENPDLYKQKSLSQMLSPISQELGLFEEMLSAGLKSSNLLLDKITAYIISSGGKRIRPILCLLFAKILADGNKVSQRQFSLAVGLELMHTATLIHDDVIDKTEKRRNVVTINKKWDDKTAILAGDYLMSKALNKLSLTKNFDVIDVFSKMLSEICEGEVSQGSCAFEIVSIENYIEKSKRKTANLFVAGVKSAVILSESNNEKILKEAELFAENFGIAFQIRDDVLNFIANEDETGKPSGIDLLNGTITAPVIYAAQEYEENNDFRLRKLITTKFKNSCDFEEAKSLIFSSTSIKKSQKLTQFYIDSAKQNLSIIPDSVYKRCLLELTDYLNINQL